MLRACLGVAIVFGGATSPALAQSTWFVDDDAPSGGDGTSWATAFQFLQDALAVVADGDEVRIAGGSYRPDQGGGQTPGDHDAKFALDSLTIAGGYRGLAGGGGADDRDFALFPSILSGDLAQDDPSLADNSSLLVELGGDAVLDGLVLEATVARPGVAGGVAIWSHLLVARDCEFREHERTACGSLDYGSLTAERCWFHHNHNPSIAGVWVITLEDSLFEDHDDGVIGLFGGDTLTASRCVFRRNVDDQEGAVINAYGSYLTLDDCVFEDNTSTGIDYFGGGAIMCFDGGSLLLHRTRFTRNTSASSGGAIDVWSPDDAFAVEVEGCVFEDNHADTSGALSLFLFDPVALVDCRFVGNSAVRGSGAGGAYLHSIVRCAFLDNSASSGNGGFGVGTDGWDAEIVDSTFERNTGTTVAALSVFWAPSGDEVRLERCTVAGNHATSATGTAVSSISKAAQSFRVADAILFDNDRNGVEDEAAQLTAAAGVIQIDRSCVEGWTGALGGSGNFGSDPLFVDPANGRFDLQLGSPCVEAGDAAYVPAAGLERDVAGNGRVLDAQLDRSPDLDLGAYEFTHARISVAGSATPGGSLTLSLDGTPGLPALLLLGFGESALRVGSLGYLFLDLGAPFLLQPWSAAPSQVTASLPSDTPVPLTFFLQAAVFQAPSGSFSNLVRVDVR